MRAHHLPPAAEKYAYVAPAFFFSFFLMGRMEVLAYFWDVRSALVWVEYCFPICTFQFVLEALQSLQVLCLPTKELIVTNAWVSEDNVLMLQVWVGTYLTRDLNGVYY